MLKTISTITNAIGALNYKGTWNAATNTPTLADGTGAKGDYYVVSTAGTQTFGGVQLFFGLGDWIVYNGAVWQRVEGGSDGNFANVTLTSTDAGATAAPLLDLFRDSASPAASDTLGEIEFNGEDSAGNKQTYGVIHASILSPTSTAEQGQLHFETATAGALTEKMIIGTNNLVINEIGAVFNVRIEGDADANLFYTDATNSRVGIGTASPAEKLDVVGAIKLSDNLIQGTAAKGFNFTANTPATGMTSQLLNWYEQGTWTVTLFDAAGAGNASSTTVTGYYTRIGNLVTCSFTGLNSISTAGMTAGNTLYISMPFTASSTGIGTGSCSFENFAFGAGRTNAIPVMLNSNSRAVFRAYGSGTTSRFLIVSDVTSGSAAIDYFSLSYRA
jgi:hypothetical protein